MRVNRKWLRISLIIAVLLSLLVAMDYIGNLADYNRHVKSALETKKPLNYYQQNILTSVIYNKIEFAICLALIFFVAVIKSVEPKFSNKLQYYGD